MATGLPKLRVRAPRHYPVRFLIDLGQRNATFVKRPLTPLRRLIDAADAFAFVPEPGYDILHSLNAVPLLTRRPYVLTFEDFLPRVPEDRYIAWLERWLRGKLLNDQCVAVIAMSEFGLRQFRWQSRDWDGREALERKMHLLYPAMPARRARPKPFSGSLRLLFVAYNFMLKGGPALLRAHARLRKAGVPVETTIVSALQYSPKDYFGPPSPSYVEAQLQGLRQEGITHHARLPNPEVLRLMEASDFFVFATFQDTFGFAPVEALACGTPVLATATCAQPEIVDDGVNGWLLPFDNEEHVGKWRWLYRTREPGYVDAYEAAIERISGAIVERMLSFDPARYEEMSAAALEKIRTRFDAGRARERLEELYELCRARL